MRGLTTFTLLMKRGAVGDGDIAAVKSFAQSRSFDLDHYPGMPRAEANQVNVQAAPELFDGVAALAGRDRDAFISRYKFDIAPATDDRPYFHNFFRWRTRPNSSRCARSAGRRCWNGASSSSPRPWFRRSC